MNSSPLFKAFFVTQTEPQKFTASLTELPLDELPEGDVLIQVEYSSLNYKDALSAVGHPGVTKTFPHVPGIDAAGIVVDSKVSELKVGDRVLVTGFDLGMNTWGGFAQYIRVPADWIVPLPQGLSLSESTILGTAGLTAALCIQALEHNEITPASGEVLVTGATGGVGSIAVSILAQLGYEVVAVTGKKDRHNYLRSLGAASILSREAVNDRSGKSLLKERWAGVVDTVGGNTLSTVLKSTKYQGCVTHCGLVGGAEFAATVYPFILRGIRLIGIDSVRCPMQTRLKMWEKLASDWKPIKLNEMVTTVQLSGLSEKIDAILKGENVGRVLVSVR